MNTLIQNCVGAIIVAAVAAGCGPSGREQAEQTAKDLTEAGERIALASEELATSIEDGGEGMADAILQVQQAAGLDTNAEPTDFRELKAVLPSELDGFTAGKAIGERTKIMGMGSSKAQVRLSTDEGSILVVITDTGSAANWAALASRAAGTLTELDRETEQGFERAGMVDGMPTQESFNNEGGRGRIHLLYADRFSIEITGTHVAWEDMEAARDAIDLGRLDELKAASIETAQAADDE